MLQLAGHMQITSHLIRPRVANVDGQVEKGVEFGGGMTRNTMEHPDAREHEDHCGRSLADFDELRSSSSACPRAKKSRLPGGMP